MIFAVLSLFLGGCKWMRAAYEDNFGKSPFDCVSIYSTRVSESSHEKTVWLKFGTCPKEVTRILKQQTYTRTVLEPAMIREENARTLGKVNDDDFDWWNIGELGGDCVKYELSDSVRHDLRVLYISSDSSSGYFYRDSSK